MSDVRIIVFREKQRVSIDAEIDGESVGYIDLYCMGTRFKLHAECREDAACLKKRHHFKRYVVVQGTEVLEDFRNQGIGVKLYVAAVRAARDFFDAALVSGFCANESTEEEAVRVWQSRRFRAAVDVEGQVAYAYA